MTTRRVDVAVVGASFAGLACARALAARGLSVLVLEKKSDPGLRPRTTGILVKEVSDAWAIPARLTRPIAGVRLYAPSLRYVDLDRPGYSFLATDTPELLRWLAHEAVAAGAEISCGQGYSGARRLHRGVEINAGEVVARYLVGADGARSRVASDFGLPHNREFLAGVELELAGVEGMATDRLHCFIDARLAPGYIAWAFAGCGISQVGLAVRHSRGDRIDPAGRLDRLRAKLGRVFDLSGARIVGRRAGLIPVGGPLRPFAGENLLLVGDAAGVVSPLTAGGIRTALHFGRRAGETLADFLCGAGPAPEEMLATELPRFVWKGALRRVIDLGPPDLLVNLILGTAPIRALARLIFFHHRGLLSRELWRELFARWTRRPQVTPPRDSPP